MALYKKIHKRQRAADNRGFYEVGDIVDLDPNVIRNFTDQWERVGPEEPEDLGPPMTSDLKLHPRGGGWFDVVNAETDKALNTRGLRLTEAEDLILELNS